ncbi:MAG: hypothetical protein ACPL5F_14155 [Moorellaceae bacterium]
MSIELREGNLLIDESLTVEEVRSAWNLIVENLQEIKTVDLRSLKEIDWAGIQVLLMLVRWKEEIKLLSPATPEDSGLALFSFIMEDDG